MVMVLVTKMVMVTRALQTQTETRRPLHKHRGEP